MVSSVTERDPRPSSGMVVNHDDGARTQLEGALGDLPGIDRRVVHGAGLLAFMGDEGVAANWR
jgi:hypothetical protein